MKGMFDDYDSSISNIDRKRPPIPVSKLDPSKPNKPFADYNAEGEMTGYWWYWGDCLNLEFDIYGELVVEDTEDSHNSFYVLPDDWFTNKQVTFKLYNFRREVIVEQCFNASSKIIVPITPELSKQLVKGVYYCSLTIWEGEEYNQTIFYQDECTLTVK